MLRDLEGTKNYVITEDPDETESIDDPGMRLADGDVNGQVWYSGCFNMDALVWDASYNTDAEKAAAFAGAPTPTTIIVAKRGA